MYVSALYWAKCVHARKGLALPRASHSAGREIALSSSRHLRFTLAAAPVLSMHADATVGTKRTSATPRQSTPLYPARLLSYAGPAMSEHTTPVAAPDSADASPQRDDAGAVGQQLSATVEQTILFAKNVDVDAINNARMHDIPGDAVP